MGIAGWLLTLLLVVAVSFAGLLLNRRALIISTMIYVAFLIYRVLHEVSMGNAAAGLLITVMLIGLYMTALGSRWRKVRSYVMNRLPQWKWLEKLPVK